MNEDALGTALLAKVAGKKNQQITVLSDISEVDVIPVDYLFRSYDEMPKIEQLALNLCKGKVLDVGAGSGCHSLELQEKGLEVEAIDVSTGAVKIMEERGISAQQLNFFDVSGQYDTLLLLMNGVGIAGELAELPYFLNKCKSLLKPEGQILLDSSDISYMYHDQDGSTWVDLNKPYYGEVIYQMQYNDIITKPFNWLFVDFETLKEKALATGFTIELTLEDDDNQYLARLSL